MKQKKAKKAQKSLRMKHTKKMKHLFSKKKKKEKIPKKIPEKIKIYRGLFVEEYETDEKRNKVKKPDDEQELTLDMNVPVVPVIDTDINGTSCHATKVLFIE